MRSVTRVVLCLLAVGLIEARAEKTDLNMEAELKATSAFVWRGRTLNDEACLQPFFGINYGDLSANVWGSWNLTDVENEWLSSRLDFSIYYTIRKNRNILRPGASAYVYHHDPGGDGDNIYECFLSYTYDTLLLPSAAVYYGFGGLDGLFATFSIAHSFTLVADKMALDLKLQLEGADKDYSNDLFKFPEYEQTAEYQQTGASIVDATLTASLPISVGKSGVLTPALKYIQILDSVTSDAVKNADQDAGILVYSLAYSMTF